MSFSINTNVTSLQAQANLAASSAFQSKTINRVTSGLRIVDSGDDAAGLAIANGFRSDQAVLNQGIRNANDGLSTLQTIDGGMNNISLLLDRARTLATQSASGTFTGDRTLLNSEFSSVLSEINRQAQSVGMNSGGEFAKDLTTYIGGGKDATGGAANSAAIANGTVGVDLSNSAVDARSLGLATFQTTAPTTAPVLSTIVGGGATQDFVFNGAGFSGANAVVVSAVGMNTATTMSDVVAKINAGIATASAQVGAPAAAFKAAGIVASLSSDGKSIVFGSANAQFSVSADATGTAGAENILGTTIVGQAVSAAGAQSATLGWGGDLIAGVQQLVITTTDTSGNQISQQVNLAPETNKDAAIAAINTALQTAGGNLGKLVAVDEDTLHGPNTGSIRILGAQNFQVLIGPEIGPDVGAGVNNGIGAGLQAQNVAVTSASSGSAGAVDITTAANASQAVNALSNAVSTLGAAQAAVGKGENNFNYAMNLAQSQTTNLAAAESRIRDADLAAEAANLTKAQILVQAGTAALAQANSAPQAILSLLK
jgi:flagellin